MKTKQELLDFYGVEIGKKYRVTKVYNDVSDGFLYKTFTTEKSSLSLGGIRVKFEDNEIEFAITLLSHFDYEEYNPILDDVEREFLQKYVMDNPAFKGKVVKIVKIKDAYDEQEYLVINLLNDDCVGFPSFKQGTMYKGMELDKEHTPKELGLEE